MRHIVIPLGEVKPSPIDTNSIGTMESDMITLSDGSTIPNTPEALAAHRRAEEAGRRSMRAAAAKRLALNTGRRCPLQFDENAGRARECKADCVFYADDSCVFSAQEATDDTAGRMCPFMRRCVKDCAWYNDGCTIGRG